MRAAWERDSAIERVSVLTRAVVAASIVLSVVFTALVAWAHPGRAKSASGTSRNSSVPVSLPPAPARAYGADTPESLPASTAAPGSSTSSTSPPSAYMPQPYLGGGGGGIVSGQT